MRHYVREPINGLKAFLLEREAAGKNGLAEPGIKISQRT
jgi:hypothetical protein